MSENEPGDTGDVVPKSTSYPKPLLEEMDSETLKRWKQRIEQKVERLEFEKDKIETELSDRGTDTN